MLDWGGRGYKLAGEHVNKKLSYGWWEGGPQLKRGISDELLPRNYVLKNDSLKKMG